MDLVPVPGADLPGLEKHLAECLPASLKVLSALHMTTKMKDKDHNYFMWKSEDGLKMVVTVKSQMGFGRHAKLDKFSVFTRGMSDKEVRKLF